MINRRGEISMVMVGDAKGIFIPSLDAFRAASTRFKGLRLIHTHLGGEELSAEDLTDMSHLRLDLIGALQVQPRRQSRQAFLGASDSGKSPG